MHGTFWTGRKGGVDGSTLGINNQKTMMSGMRKRMRQRVGMRKRIVIKIRATKNKIPEERQRPDGESSN